TLQLPLHLPVQPDWRPSTRLNGEEVKAILLKTRNEPRKLAEKAVRPAVVTSTTIRRGRRRHDARAGGRAAGADCRRRRSPDLRSRPVAARAAGFSSTPDRGLPIFVNCKPDHYPGPGGL